MVTYHSDVIKSLVFNCFFLTSGWFVTELVLRHHPGLTFAPKCSSSGTHKCNKDLFKNTPEVDQQILRIEKSFYRSYAYRGGGEGHQEQGSASARWGVMTRSHQYEMIKEEPRTGLNGMRRRELEEVDRLAKTIVASSESTEGKQVELVDVLRHHDPYHGVRYIVSYKPAGSGDDVITTTSVELERAYVTGKPVLKRMTSLGNDDVINMIMPISKVTSRFNKFIERLESALKREKNNAASSPVRLVFVVFQPEDDVKGDVTLRRIEELRGRGLDVRWKVVRGEFNRAKGIDIGVGMVGGDELMTFMDVDLTVTSHLFRTIRLNTRRGRTVFFPTVFSQYDPEIMRKAEKLYPPLALENKFYEDPLASMSKNSGFWLHYAYGIVSIYKSDYHKAGGLKTDIEGWGGEDVDFFKRCVAMETDGDDVMEVMTSVERDLVHVYHERGCDPRLEADQYRMCIGAWSETLASQLQAGLLYRHVTNGDDVNK